MSWPWPLRSARLTLFTFLLKSCEALILYWNTDKTHYRSRDGPRIGVGISCFNSIAGCQGEINYSGQVVKGAIVLHRCGTATIGEAFVSWGAMPKQQPGQGGMEFYTHVQYLSNRHLSTDRECCKYSDVVNSKYLTMAFVSTCICQNANAVLNTKYCTVVIVLFLLWNSCASFILE